MPPATAPARMTKTRHMIDLPIRGMRIEETRLHPSFRPAGFTRSPIRLFGSSVARHVRASVRHRSLDATYLTGSASLAWPNATTSRYREADAGIVAHVPHASNP